MKQKTYKAAGKRLRIKTGKKRTKILHIVAGRDHFNAREPGKVTSGKRRHAALSPSYTKSVKTMLPGVR